ncbi:MAG: DEAD/DEAH box helicase [Lysobacter sp.]|nr:DEAD/DEAH box helicase [Lysobacter sp.]
MVLAGRDLLGAAQTGTGKTAGFTLPLLQRLAPYASKSFSPALHPVRCLILTPTRELAIQVYESVRTYGKHIALKPFVVYGGVNINPQIAEMRKGVEILVATPGRLLDLMGQKAVDLRHVQILVLDEADRMLDMGFIPDIKRIINTIPGSRQTLLFSATFSDEIRKLSAQFLKDPATVEVARRNTPAESVTQWAHMVESKRKRELLAHLVKTNNWEQVLVFCKTKHGANRLAYQLERDGINAAAIHGNKSQNARIEALESFKQNKVRVLVATDIAARGLDIEALPHVVNFDLPTVAEDYVHRIGRTGRAGMEGEAITIVCAEDRPMFAAVEALIKKKIEVRPVPGFDGTRAATYPGEIPEDSRGERGRGRGRGGQGAERGAERGSRPPRDQKRTEERPPRAENQTGERPPRSEKRAEERPPRAEKRTEERPPRSGKRAEERPPRSAPKPAAGDMDFSKPYEPAADAKPIEQPDEAPVRKRSTHAVPALFRRKAA